ncbi:MAG: hypothetical protein ACRCUT_04705 [Spirochaetota bacterium]
MNKELYLFSLLAVCLLSVFLSCSVQKKTGAGGYLCREHGIHSSGKKAEFSACFGIEPDKIESCYLYEKESTASDSASVSRISAGLKGQIADEIVARIMLRLEEAFGSDLVSRWHLESIDLPVAFRCFVFNDSGTYRVKVFALLKKEDLEPRSLIRFLPLEYKMNLLEPNSGELREYKDLRRP